MCVRTCVHERAYLRACVPMHVGVGVNEHVWARPGWPGYMTDSCESIRDMHKKALDDGEGRMCIIQVSQA